MASKKTLTAENLEALGARRLAALLMDIADDDAAVKRRLRLELAVREAPKTVAAEVRKRLTQIGRAGSFVDWRKIRDLAADLETQRRTIVDQVAKIDPAEALELMWRFMGLAEAVHERCDDSNGVVGDVFRGACRDLGPLAELAKPDPVALADRVFAALHENDYGQYDDLIEALAPALGAQGLDHLKARFVELSKTPVESPPEEQRKVIGWGAGGPMYEDEIKERRRVSTIRLALQEIADAQGDVDAFVAQYDEKTRKVPKIAAEIARRLLAAGRADEALETIEAAEHRRGGWPDFDWEDARIEALDALGRGDDAQAARWSCFERALSAEHLRAYLKRLPDFDDVEAETRALDHAERYESLLQALAFFVSWPALDRAARLVTRRAGELDGNHYEILSPAADALAGKHPLAATLVLRAMIGFTLAKARSSRYRHAARHFLECASLASSVADYGAFGTHEAYAARLKAEHGRKSGFWSLIS
ncbi:DUF6880 family protein [Elioraea tepidiphila]|uniref:DUF6880 family protein n=1 Tax=Elioraea tepidiphila TaxID=457934 RepID=UPI000374BCAA|nr:DUF6880 family protein [Elioraea tepidiphila]